MACPIPVGNSSGAASGTHSQNSSGGRFGSQKCTFTSNSAPLPNSGLAGRPHRYVQTALAYSLSQVRAFVVASTGLLTRGKRRMQIVRSSWIESISIPHIFGFETWQWR